MSVRAVVGWLEFVQKEIFRLLLRKILSQGLGFIFKVGLIHR